MCNFTPLGVPIEADGSQAGDAEPDCDVDLIDCGAFAVCLNSGGPETPPGAGCLDQFNYDGDGDTDLEDFARFQSVFTGTGP